MNAPSPPRPAHDSNVATLEGASIHDIRKATRKMRSWYESLADYMIVHPTASQDELAQYFGRNVSTISTVVNTDSFKMYFRQRRAAQESTLDAQVRQKLFRLADNSIDTMLTVLEKKKDSVPIESLQRMSEMAFKNLGYGASANGSGVTVNVGAAQPATVNVAVSLSDLERAREALRRQQTALPEPIDAEYTELAPLERGATDTSNSSPTIVDGSGEPTPASISEDRPALEDLA
jgi:hypothetical protein